MLAGHFEVLIYLLMADRNGSHSNLGANVCLCASVVAQACKSDLRERGGHPPSCASLGSARGLKMNPYLKPSAERRNAEVSALNGLDRLVRLMPFY